MKIYMTSPEQSGLQGIIYFTENDKTIKMPFVTPMFNDYDEFRFGNDSPGENDEYHLFGIMSNSNSFTNLTYLMDYDMSFELNDELSFEKDSFGDPEKIVLSNGEVCFNIAFDERPPILSRKQQNFVDLLSKISCLIEQKLIESKAPLNLFIYPN